MTNTATLLTVDQTRQADQLTIAAGTDSYRLMQQAARAAFREIIQLVRPGARVLVLCGTGNNGGDGLVIARLLHQAHVNVTVVVAGQRERLSDDAASALADLPIELTPLEAVQWSAVTVIVDALLGAGLSRSLTGELAATVQHINAHPAQTLSIDIPSGIDGDSGSIRGVAVNADVTLTFFRKKPAHVLFPGRGHCGRTCILDIGISDDVERIIAPTIQENLPGNWLSTFPFPDWQSHKYSRGHVAVGSGPASATGAARLSSMAALRAGAGVVTLISPQDAVMVNAAQTTAELLRVADDLQQWQRVLDARAVDCLVLGPGFGAGGFLRDLVLLILERGLDVVLDADALTSFEACPDVLFDAIRKTTASVVLTPHHGEFKRLFAADNFEQQTDSPSPRYRLATDAAALSSATVIYKGADTVIASPHGRTAINTNAPGWLATAGSGDVLAGTIAGLIAQRMPVFDAACAASWMHAEAASCASAGLIAPDICAHYPQVLQALWAKYNL